MTKATRIPLGEAFDNLEFVGDRTPASTPETLEGAFATLSEYRDGGVFIGHYAGSSDWERHSRGDEIVMVIEGETTLFLLSDGKETANRLAQGELFVVPADTWHRFETPEGVKIMTVTPQPTDHSAQRPEVT